jgi:hypothetical protein
MLKLSGPNSSPEFLEQGGAECLLGRCLARRGESHYGGTLFLGGLRNLPHVRWRQRCSQDSYFNIIQSISELGHAGLELESVIWNDALWLSKCAHLPS